jgi:hypothetical protein
MVYLDNVMAMIGLPMILRLPSKLDWDEQEQLLLQTLEVQAQALVFVYGWNYYH